MRYRTGGCDVRRDSSPDHFNDAGRVLGTAEQRHPAERAQWTWSVPIGLIVRARLSLAFGCSACDNRQVVLR